MEGRAVWAETRVILAYIMLRRFLILRVYLGVLVQGGQRASAWSRKKALEKLDVSIEAFVLWMLKENDDKVCVVILVFSSNSYRVY